MNRITKVKRPKRSYESALRQDQTEATRTRILDALVRTMAKGVAGLSVPAVAREAGVSVPTMYRYFKTKADLVAALAPYLVGKSGLMELPKDAGDLGTVVRELYRRNEAMDLETRAALASELGQEVRRRTMPQRVAMIRSEISRWTPGLAGEDLDRFTRLMLILGSSAAMRAYKDYLGLGAMAAADDVVWALEALQRALRRKRS